MADKEFAWSWSALQSFETCPYRHAETKVFKRVADPIGPEGDWGNRVHKALENRVKDRTPLPETMQQYEPIAAKILTAGQGGIIDAEQKMALDRDFNPTTYFAKNCWVRVISDVTLEKKRRAIVLDYKTGKPGRATQQLALTAAATFHCRPHINEITTAYLWLADGSMTPEQFTRGDVAGIWQEFAPRILRMERAVEQSKFPKNPSGLCRKHCPVKTCEHNGDYTPPLRTAFSNAA